MGETRCGNAPLHLAIPPFSILERIDVGETKGAPGIYPPAQGLSVSSNGSTWVKPVRVGICLPPPCRLSVSSNGSTWVKLTGGMKYQRQKRLSVSSNGSTWVKRFRYRRFGAARHRLSVSSNGSTWVKRSLGGLMEIACAAFSILERIDVGETQPQRAHLCCHHVHFQYPRTDRRG